jgi:hypothetical protein
MVEVLILAPVAAAVKRGRLFVMTKRGTIKGNTLTAR